MSTVKLDYELHHVSLHMCCFVIIGVFAAILPNISDFLKYHCTALFDNLISRVLDVASHLHGLVFFNVTQNQQRQNFFQNFIETK